MYQKRVFLIIIVGLSLVTACSVMTTRTPQSAITPAPTAAPELEPVDEPPVDPSEEPAIVSHGDEIGGFVELVDALRAAGISVEPAGQIDQPFFSVAGQVITVGGEYVQVFEYPDTAAAEAEAALISPNASSVGTSMISRVATPLFYALDRVIVLYVGDDQDVVAVLNEVLGQRMAEG